MTDEQNTRDAYPRELADMVDSIGAQHGESRLRLRSLTDAYVVRRPSTRDHLGVVALVDGHAYFWKLDSSTGGSPAWLSGSEPFEDE